MYEAHAAGGDAKYPVEVNRLVGEAKGLGHTDMDPLVEFVFRDPAWCCRCCDQQVGLAKT